MRITLEPAAGQATLHDLNGVASAAAPRFVKREGSENWLDGIDIGDDSKPAFVDLDGDGDVDFVAGEGDVYNHNLSPFNAGVWIVANTRLGRALMARWCSVYTETASKYWRRDPKGRHTGQDDLSWRCEQPDPRASSPSVRVAVRRVEGDGVSKPSHGVGPAAVFEVILRARRALPRPPLILKRARGVVVVLRWDVQLALKKNVRPPRVQPAQRRALAREGAGRRLAPVS